MRADPRTHPDEDDELPEVLRAELKAAWVAPREIPAELDQEIRAAIPRVPVEGPRRWYQRPQWIVAAAAAAVLAILWFRPYGQQGISRVADLQTPPPYFASRGTDVLEAFQLARLLRDRVQRLDDVGWDVDRNGRVDQADVERLLDLAVRLEG